MTGVLVWGALGWLGLVVACGLAIWIGTRRMPAPGFMDPAIRADREVEALDAIWEMPSFDPRETA